MTESYSVVWTDHILFAHPSADKHLAVMNSCYDAINSAMHTVDSQYVLIMFYKLAVDAEIENTETLLLG